MIGKVDPSPAVTLQSNQALQLAKAEPGGEYVVLGDSLLADGVLSAQVRSFSFFIPVVVSYQLPIFQAAPMSVTTSLDCGGQDCDAATGSVSATFSVATNSGQLPGGCTGGVLRANQFWSARASVGPTSPALPMAGGQLARTVVPGDLEQRAYFVVGATCGGFSWSLPGARTLTWLVPPAYPGLAVLGAPAQLDVVEGQAARLDVILMGGAVKFPWDWGLWTLPSPADHAIVDWQRSDDGGGSWRNVARSLQDEADPRPAGSTTDWRWWDVHHGFVASSSDQGALLRAYACYAPQDAPPPPCVTGSSTRLNVLTASSPPVIVTQPAPVLVGAGDTATFAVGVSGAGPLTFQWSKDGAPLAGATEAVLTLVGVVAADAGVYAVVVTGPGGVATSGSAALTLSTGSPTQTAPTITTQPASLVVLPGGAATLAVAASGSGPLSFQWFDDGTPVAGATSAVLLLPAVTAANLGPYTVAVTNPVGSVLSDAATLSLVGEPFIVDDPAPATATSGETATFLVGAGRAALHYQWQRDGAPIPGATEASYTTPALTVGDDGALFSALVYNGAGLVSSAAARLTVHGINPPGMALFAGDFALGFGGGAADGTGIDARFDAPDGLVADAAGNLYVAESNQPAVAKVDPAGVVTTLLHHPNAINSLALGPDGSLYVGAACGMPRLLPPLVAGGVNQPVQVGYCPGQVRGVTVDDAGAVLVSLPGLNSIRGVAINAGVVSFPVFAGAANEFITPGTSDGNGTSARFHGQQGMARAPDGTLYVADTENHTIRKVTPAGDVTTWIGLAGVPGLVDGRGAAARLYRPTQLAFDTSGNLYVLTQGDPAAPVAHVHRISPAGDVTTVFDATAEVLAIAPPAQAAAASSIKGLAVLGADRVALTAGNAIVIRTL